MELDRHPLPSLDPSWLGGKALGIISQEPVLFAASVKENIKYGRPSAVDKEVRRGNHPQSSYSVLEEASLVTLYLIAVLVCFTLTSLIFSS